MAGNACGHLEPHDQQLAPLLGSHGTMSGGGGQPDQGATLGWNGPLPIIGDSYDGPRPIVADS